MRIKFRSARYDKGAMVHLSERAATKVRELMAAENDPSLGALRVAVEGGGCSGFQYALGFDTAPASDDESWELHGVRVIVDRHSLPYLEGATLDYIDGISGVGFQIDNPNVTAACGCGNSFHANEAEEPVAEIPDADGDCDSDCGCTH
jgi:iron-sulfur cluster assembly protein